MKRVWMKRRILNLPLWRDCKGQDFIEYALMVGLVATGIGILLPATMIPVMSNTFSVIVSNLHNAGGS